MALTPHIAVPPEPAQGRVTEPSTIDDMTAEPTLKVFEPQQSLATTTDQMSATVVDQHVFLRGRPPLTQFLDFVMNEAVDGDKLDRGRLASDWRDANDRLRELESEEAGHADSPTIEPLPPELLAVQERLLADPILQRVFNIVPVSIGLVNLDTLVVFQKHINLAHVSRIQNGLGTAPTPEQVIACCLPFEHVQPPVQLRRIANNAYAFVSPSDDLRFLEGTLLAPTQISEHTPYGPVTGVVALMVGFGTNYLNAISVENRLILNNGSHRAYALRDLGLTQAPCLIQHVSRREELDALTNSLEPDPDLYLKSSRPPLLKDYFDEQLRKVIAVPRKLRQITVAFHIQQVDVPAI